ncbi:MAG: protein translocase subunit SecF [Bryobacter sp.]|nr:protein translocase subunit SecF [Bryobacter sp.]
MEIFKDTNFDFLGKKWIFIVPSILLMLVSFVSLGIKGGPLWGIDFKGGALLDVRFAQLPSIDKIRSALAARIPGEISVQEVRGSSSVLIGVELKDAQKLDQSRALIIDTLSQTFGNTGAKLDLNNAGAAALADRLRGPLATAGAGLSDEQLVNLMKSVLEFRDKERSGLVQNFDDLKAVPGMTDKVLAAMKQELGTAPFVIRNVEVVSPKVTGELRTQAIMATLYALAAMLVYIAFRFEFVYGFAAVLAVFHDTLITIGLFSIFNKEISLTVVAALLTLVGYSMNDTIVVFDRIRENLKLLRREKFEPLVNKSINQTLARTIMVSGLTLLTALSLWVFGGQVLNGFAFALVVGIIVGTYSSIFVASPIVVFWQNFAESRKRGGSTVAVAAGGKKAVK